MAGAFTASHCCTSVQLAVRGTARQQQTTASNVRRPGTAQRAHSGSSEVLIRDTCQRRGLLIALGGAALLLPTQQASAGFGWDGSSAAQGSCALGEAGDECRKAVLMRDRAGAASYAASSTARRAETAVGVPVAEMNDEYTLATLDLGDAIERYANLDLYDPARVKVIQTLKKEGAAWTSKYARGGSARKLSARRFYIAIDALQGHITANGFAPFPKQKMATIMKNWEDVKQLLAEGR